MTTSIHRCVDCRHYREPVRPSAFASGTMLSGRQFESATRELNEQDQDRAEEEARFEDERLFDWMPGFYPWCAKFTLSDEEIGELNRRLRLGDFRLAREKAFMKLVRLDGAAGFIPFYTLCDRQNPNNDCVAFERQTGGPS
jgi:hypothetical protein